MKDAEALYDNVSALDNAMNQALDSWYRKENEKTASEIKGAEVGYKVRKLPSPIMDLLTFSASFRCLARRHQDWQLL